MVIPLIGISLLTIKAAMLVTETRVQARFMILKQPMLRLASILLCC